ncbi:hypothetical protein FDG2_1514 [Candidatus Protofrankia californiensis]|uniref:Uncharacterized protein n=1 Tax=Candidatus Protofrankia californiensis TaxID=1839754 RepID=A0A1C3NVT7_9ACTN|nr:hypothetical protein FDG2_1514 [Candidatus Protofrankia californiensis]
MNVEKLERSSLVKLLPETPEEWSDNQRAAALQKIIVECCHAITQEKLRTGAQIGFNIDGENPDESSLTARIDALAHRRGRHERTVREWFYRGTVEAALLLRQRVTELNGRAGWQDYLPGNSPPDLLDADRPRFLLDRTELLVRLSGRIPAEVLIFRSLVALDDGIDRYVATARYHSDPRPGVVSVEPLANCAVRRSAFTPNGYEMTELGFSTALQPGHRISFAYRLLIHTDREMTPVLNYSPKAQQSSRYIFQLQFDPTAPPVRVWYFNGVLGPETRLHPDNEDHWLEPSSLGYVRKDFVELSRRLHYGVAWDWPQDSLGPTAQGRPDHDFRAAAGPRDVDALGAAPQNFCRAAPAGQRARDHGSFCALGGPGA